jgi:5'-nucleotidase
MRPGSPGAPVAGEKAVMTTPTVALDLDSIGADLMTDWLRLYNDRYGDDLTMAVITDWDTSKFVRPECGRDIFKLLHTPGLYENLRPIEGFLEAVQELRTVDQVRVVISTSCIRSWAVAGEKLRWLAKMLPGQQAADIHLGEAKDIVRADVLVDDGPHNARAFRAANPRAYVATIGYPYNGPPYCPENLYDLRTPMPTTPGEERRCWQDLLAGIRGYLRRQETGGPA